MSNDEKGGVLRVPCAQSTFLGSFQDLTDTSNSGIIVRRF
jgi:hypothetical protein